MAFDYKKEYKEFYMPKGTPSIVTVPKMNYIAVRGSGNPNDADGEYKQAIGLAPKIEVIQSAIENRRIIRFKYYAPSGESNRRVEPYYLVFRWSSWYVWGWCLEREDYRLFKLNRMDCVVETDRGFLRRDVPMPDLSNEKIFPGGIKVKALFTPNMKWRLVEEFGPNCFTETDDGRLLFSADYTDMENLVTWIMTFGAKVEVLEPEEVRDIIRRNAEKILKIYEEKT